GQRGWRKVLEKYRVTAAVVDLGSQCTALLRTSPEWELAYEDRLDAIFLRRDASGGHEGGPVAGRVQADPLECFTVAASVPRPSSHVHPERLDAGDDALGAHARWRPVVAPHALRRRVGDEPPRLLDREEGAAAADLPLLAERVLGVRDVVHAVARGDEVGRVQL